jgi:short-subunit dehydrogenase
MPPSRTIAITGASSGLGAAMAFEFASPDVTLALAARRQELLEQVREVCVARGARVTCACVDVCDAQQVEEWVASTDRAFPIDLAIANAGIFSGHGPSGEIEDGPGFSLQIGTNLSGTIAMASAAARRMRQRGHGHIALISSLAALLPLADAPSYSASKAGILAYGEALREYFAASGITVSVILPGHIATAQTLLHAGPLPGILTAGKAAQIIRRRLEKGETFIAFPRRMLWLVRLSRLLPWRVRARVNQPFRFFVRTEETHAEPG